MFASDENIKVTDCGIVKVFAGPRLTKTGTDKDGVFGATVAPADSMSMMPPRLQQGPMTSAQLFGSSYRGSEDAPWL